MKKTVGLIALVMILVQTGIVTAAEEAPKLNIKTKANLETFYELSDDVGGDGDNDKFKANQLYLYIDADCDKGYCARLLLDGADIVSSDGKVVTEKIVEEANFTIEDIAGAPVSVCFGKDEQPFGLDYDKYLNDSIAHQFEIDKVWGINATVDFCEYASLSAGTYEHRHSLKDGESTVTSDKSLFDSYTARLKLKKIMKVLDLSVSASSEAYSDVASTDSAGASVVTAKDDETRWGASAVITCPKTKGNINIEYIAFNSLKGTPGYDPALLTIGIEYPVTDSIIVWARDEIIDDDASNAVEDNFWSFGVQYTVAKSYQLMVEYSNFNSVNMKDATDLNVAKGSTEDALLVGVRAKY